MPRRPDVYLVFCLFGATHALYKQWIPDTNYENKTNWNTGVVPCGRDRVVFPARGSVYVETAHSIQEMTLPIYGELILNSGAGFYVGLAEEPGCGAGASVRFRDSDSLRWFDPGLWHAALTPDDLKNGRYVFSVHEERVPCEHDDVVFRASTSFRVDTSSGAGDGGAAIAVKSVSVLGKAFSGPSDLARYLSTASGRAQFHGGSALTVTAAGCRHPAGCACGNAAHRDLICGGVTCPALTCERPLRPAGHCCDVCGAMVTVRFAARFNLRSYRQRVQRLFLDRPAYRTARLGVSRVTERQHFPGPARAGARDRIQVVALDGGPGLVAEALARDILDDVHSHGADLGISEAEFQASSGTEERRGGGAAVVLGAVFGVLVVVALTGVGFVLVRRGHVRMPGIAMPAMPWHRGAMDDGDNGAPGGPLDCGYENPMFDKPTLLPAVPGVFGTEMSAVSMTTSGVHFVNPVYDETELTV
ncbi:unnamed protein product [Lota lota]